MKRVFIASASIVAILGIGQALATNGVVSATHAGLFCYEFKLSGSPNWYAVPMIGTGYSMQASDIASARDTGKTIGFNITSTNCSVSSPDGGGAVPVPVVQSLSIPRCRASRSQALRPSVWSVDPFIPHGPQAWAGESRKAKAGLRVGPSPPIAGEALGRFNIVSRIARTADL